MNGFLSHFCLEMRFLICIELFWNAKHLGKLRPFREHFHSQKWNLTAKFCFKLMFVRYSFISGILFNRTETPDLYQFAQILSLTIRRCSLLFKAIKLDRRTSELPTIRGFYTCACVAFVSRATLHRNNETALVAAEIITEF